MPLAGPFQGATVSHCSKLISETGRIWVSSLLAEVWETFGTLDARVNNAGMPPRQRADILEASEGSFKELLRVNLQGPYFLTRRGTTMGQWGGMASFIPTGYTIVFVTSIICRDRVRYNGGSTAYLRPINAHGSKTLGQPPG
jgi:NAD(P)-dependent dehydrogenase (short-subunit alcohol dehydrogenase family)